jgi:hypothetical protein
MIFTSQAGLKFILIVQGSPRWATTPYQADCAPINPAKYDRFAAFLAGAADSFDILPYNAYYWGDDLSSPDWKTV